MQRVEEGAPDQLSQVLYWESVQQVRNEKGGGICGILFGGRRHFGVADGVRPFHGDHPRVLLEVSGCGEAGEVPLEVVLIAAGLALDAIYK